MPKKAKSTTGAETTSAEAAPEGTRGTKKAAIKAALKANPNKSNAEISELLAAEGWEAKPTYISVVKSNMKRKKKSRKAAPAAAPEATAQVPQDAVSLASLKKAKELAAQLGGIKEAKAALAALSQLMD